MNYRIKEKYKNKCITVKAGTHTFLFLTDKNYSQEKLEKFSKDKYLSEYVEEDKQYKIKDDSILKEVSTESLELTYVDDYEESTEEIIEEDIEDSEPQIKDVEGDINFEDYNLTELRDLYPDISARSKKEFIDKIGNK